jgi:hypothetical protein
MQKHGTMKDVHAPLRHTSITMTADIYVQQIPESVRAAVNARTWEILGVSGQEHTSEVATQLCPTVPQLPDLSDARILKKIGGRGRNRTYNLSIKSRMLCQLSYASEGKLQDGSGRCDYR